MAVITLSDLRDKVLGTRYQNSGVFTADVVNGFINEAIAELFDLVASQGKGHYDKTSTIVTVAGTQNVTLPSDFYELRALDIERDSETVDPLRQLTQQQTYGYSARGEPVGYQLFGGVAPGTVRLWPIPDGVYTLRVTYTPLLVPLSSDDDTFDCRNGWEEYIVLAARLRLADEEEMPLGDLMARLERASRRIVGGAKGRNSGEPDHCTNYADNAWQDNL